MSGFLNHQQYLIKKKMSIFQPPCTRGFIVPVDSSFWGIFCSPTRSCEITQRLGWLEPWGLKFMRSSDVYLVRCCNERKFQPETQFISIHIFCPVAGHHRILPMIIWWLLITVSLDELRTMLMQWASGSWKMRQIYEIWWSKDEWSKNFPCNQSESLYIQLGSLSLQTSRIGTSSAWPLTRVEENIPPVLLTLLVGRASGFAKWVRLDWICQSGASMGKLCGVFAF